MRLDIRTAEPGDIEAILALQEASLLENMRADEARMYGFLRTLSLIHI